MIVVWADPIEAMDAWPARKRRDLKAEREPGPTIKEIVAQVAEKHGLTFSQLCGPQTCRAIAWPRHEAMWRAYQTGRFSNQQIARVLGKRDHSTVIYGRREHAKRAALARALDIAAWNSLEAREAA